MIDFYLGKGVNREIEDIEDDPSHTPSGALSNCLCSALSRMIELFPAN